MIYFVPPDGEFTLLSYRYVPEGGGDHSKPLLWCECVVERETDSSLDLLLRIRSNYKRKSACNNVNLHLPVPEDIDTPRFKPTIGSCKYRPERAEVTWHIGYFPGGKEYSLQVKMGKPSVRNKDVLAGVGHSGSGDSVNSTGTGGGRRPMTVDFELPYFTLSGLQVRYLKIVEKSGYQALPWVRYITQNGLYQVRLPDHEK
jgi:AP-1 complex subunit mu